MRTRRSAVDAAKTVPPSRRAIAAADDDDDETVAVARGLSTASICAVAASAATATTFAVRKATKNLFSGEAAVLAAIVAVWMVLFAFLVGLPSSGEDAIPVVVVGDESSESRLADRIWDVIAIPMAALDSARDAILSIPDMLPSFESANDERDGGGGDDAVKLSDEGSVSIDYDKLTGRLLDNRNFREAVAQTMEAKMGRIRDEVMRQADDMLETVRREVRSAAANRDRRMEAIEKKVVDVENGHAAATEEALRCCGRFDDDDALRERVNKAVAEFLGNVTAASSSERDAELRSWLEDNFLSKEDMQRQLEKVVLPVVEQRVKAGVAELKGADHVQSSPPTDHGLSNAEFDRLVADALRVYDSDKTGMFDFALESAGGTIVSTRCTDPHTPHSAVYSVMGVPIWWENTSPRSILQPGSSPGQCWAFKGSQGSVVIRLSNEVNVAAVTLEHISKMITPDKSISSAPRRFAVLGLRSVDDPAPVPLGNFSYEDSGDPVQTFRVEDERGHPPFRLVELKILDNHGNMVYTCVYRFRVHGTIA